MDKKGIIARIIIVAIIIVLGIAGIWYYASRPAETSSTQAPASPSPSTSTSTSTASTTAPTITVTPTPAGSAPVASITLGKTYADPSGAFSFQYPAGLAATTTANIYNGNSLAVGNGISKELVEVEAGAAPSVSIAVPAAAASLAWINVATNPSSTQTACDAPGTGTPTGTSTKVAANGTSWYEGFQWSLENNEAHMDDEYQTYRNGTCWGVEFAWIEPSAQLENAAPIHSAEVAVLETFQF